MTTHFKVLQQGDRRWLSVEVPWESRLADIMLARGLSDLRVFADGRADAARIDFLREIPFLETLGLCIVGLRDITPLYDLPNLRSLAVQGVERKIDFTRIPRIQKLALPWNAKLFSSLLECGGLQDLGIDNFSGKDFLPFARLKSLKNIGFAFTRLESFAGIEEFPELGRLSLGPINRLETLDHLEGCPRLWYLQVEAAKKLRRIDAVSSLRCLQELCFTACPQIESIRAIEGLPALEYFGLLQTTEVADGDLSALLKLPRLKHASIRDRKNYNVKNDDLPKAYRKANKVIALHKE
jgi:hypothetical protein